MYYADVLYSVFRMSQGVRITAVAYQTISHPLSVCFKSHEYRADFKCKFCSVRF